MEEPILATCDRLTVEVEQLRQQIQTLLRENADLRSRRQSLEAQVMELAEENAWWDKVILLFDEEDTA